MPARAEVDYSRDRLKWNGWGWKDRRFPLAEDADFWGYVKEQLGVSTLPSTPSVELADLRLPAVRLTDGQLAALRGIVGAEVVKTDAAERALHAKGRSYHDLVRLRRGRVEGYPDAVVYPADEAEVERLLRFAVREDVVLIPFGGGSSVVGGVDVGGLDRAVLTLDTTRMRRLLDLDHESLTATFEAGIYGPELERALGARGFTLGHLPQSFEFSTLGGWIAARGAGQLSDRYGKVEDLLVSVRLLTPAGPLETGRFPASAAGPDLNQLVAGSEGALGVITRATVRIAPRPRHEPTFAFLFRRFDDGVAAARAIRRAGTVPVSMVRLSDADETAFMLRFRSGGSSPVRRLLKWWLARRGYADQPALMLVGLAGSASEVAAGVPRLLGTCRRHGAAFAGPHSGWRRGHFDIPYLRDDLLDRGIGIDTLETAAPWSRLRGLHRDVREAVAGAAEAAGHRVMVMAHVSHSYSDGACLYFTLAFPVMAGREVEQWRALKTAATRAIVHAGGTITHHHGVGLDHVAWMEAEKGPEGVAVLRAVKDTLDPAGIMNRGKLVPDSGRRDDAGGDAGGQGG